MVRPRRNAAQPPSDVAGGWGLAALILVIVGIVSIGKCSSGGGEGADTEASNLMETNITAGVAAQTPPPVQPLSAPSVTRGAAHFGLAYRAEGLPGAMIYSQNCYDALTHKFSWAKLDACGAFDMLAVRAIQDSDLMGMDGETNYFEAETAAGRYLAAATGGGEAAADADTRLSALQAKVARAPYPVHPPRIAKPDEETSETTKGADPADTENTHQPAEVEVEDTEV